VLGQRQGKVRDLRRHSLQHSQEAHQRSRFITEARLAPLSAACLHLAPHQVGHGAQEILLQQ
jgi:hypothetical protein